MSLYHQPGNLYRRRLVHSKQNPKPRSRSSWFQSAISSIRTPGNSPEKGNCCQVKSSWRTKSKHSSHARRHQPPLPLLLSKKKTRTAPYCHIPNLPSKQQDHTTPFPLSIHKSLPPPTPSPPKNPLSLLSRASFTFSLSVISRKIYQPDGPSRCLRMETAGDVWVAIFLGKILGMWV